VIGSWESWTLSVAGAGGTKVSEKSGKGPVTESSAPPDSSAIGLLEAHGNSDSPAAGRSQGADSRERKGVVPRNMGGSGGGPRKPDLICPVRAKQVSPRGAFLS
jgi:hypothetical protein